MTVLSDIAQVDFQNARDVAGFASLIFAAANGAGMFMAGNMSDRKVSGVKSAAKTWINEVEQNIDSFNAGDALSVAGCFDAVHRIAFGRPAKESYLNHYKLNAFEAYILGDRVVDQYILQRSIAQEIRRRNRAFLDRPLKWESLCIDCWYGEFRYGKCIDGISDYDTIQRVASLLNADLWAFETSNEGRFKQSLFDNHRHYLDEAECMDTKALLALKHFLGSSVKYLMQPEMAGECLSGESLLSGSLSDDSLSADPYSVYEESIFRAILSRPEANRYLKASVKMRMAASHISYIA